MQDNDIELERLLRPAVLSQSRVIAKGLRIRDVRRLVKTYGGRAATWAKKSSPHWFEMVKLLKSTGMNIVAWVDAN